MGQDWRSDLGISADLIAALLAQVERLACDSDPFSRDDWLLAGAYFCLCYIVSLRGPEGLLLDVGRLKELNSPRKQGMLYLPLLGKVKGENHSRHHTLASVTRTSSGIPVHTWIDRLLAIHERRGRSDGPAFIDLRSGKQSSSASMTQKLRIALLDLYDEKPSLFPNNPATDETHIVERFSAFRSFRRGSNSRALQQRVPTEDIYLINRWSRKEKAKGARPTHPMHHHYFEALDDNVLPSFLRYTQAM